MIQLRKLFFVVAVAGFAAAGIAFWSASIPYAEKLIRIQSEEKLAVLDKRIVDEPLDIQALLLDYAGDGDLDIRSAHGELVVKAWIAMTKYPEQSREVFRLYGSDPAFQGILRNYGEIVVPVIKYFLVNDVLTLVVLDKLEEAKKKASELAEKLKELWGNLWGDQPANVPAPVSPSAKHVLDSTQRGRYAISFISNEGHKFLGQFVLDSNKNAQWITVDRISGGVVSLLAGGLSNLEAKSRSDEELEKSDYFFAAIDVIPFVAAVKLIKAGKVVAASGKELSVASKTRLFAARMIPKNQALLKLGKYGVIAATGYIIATHPSLLNSVFSAIAEAFGLDPRLVQFAGWFLLISFALYPFFWVLRLSSGFLLFCLSWLQLPIRRRAL